MSVGANESKKTSVQLVDSSFYQILEKATVQKLDNCFSSSTQVLYVQVGNVSHIYEPHDNRFQLIMSNNAIPARKLRAKLRYKGALLNNFVSDHKKSRFFKTFLWFLKNVQLLVIT